MTKNNTTLADIADLLRAHRSFTIMSHVRPDGDALGCIIALGLSLRGMGKEVTLWNEDGAGEKFRYLPGWEMISKPPGEPVDVEVAIALDTANQVRLGTALGAVKSAKLWINIDHHISNEGYGDYSHIDATAPASGQIIYELIRTAGFPMTKEIADNLFAAISTDTGSFQYPNTTARTYEIAADLIRAGVKVGDLSQKMYESHPLRRVYLLRALLNVLKIACEGRAASFALTQKMSDELGVVPDDNEGLIDTIRGIEGVVVAAFIEELAGDGKVRISLRSKDPRVDVCKICKLFGGGGHTLAAGARIRGAVEEVEARVMAAICDEIHHAYPN
ncbi:MAG TPA: bifunctional oligoribonuclease/PAP phosphatase NrnA [Chthoniobacteraceae bacterium]|jgi:phosphoesterase RecJ-like protein|nr:bifunctional oligoribonuclease/PAP phosphatase NrnA [Chthoniobacteraceae bacterium]